MIYISTACGNFISDAQIWEYRKGLPDDNNNNGARCKLGGSDSLNGQ